MDCLIEQTHPDVYVGEDQDVGTCVWCVVCGWILYYLLLINVTYVLCICLCTICMCVHVDIVVSVHVHNTCIHGGVCVCICDESMLVCGVCLSLCGCVSVC